MAKHSRVAIIYAGIIDRKNEPYDKRDKAINMTTVGYIWDTLDEEQGNRSENAAYLTG